MADPKVPKAPLVIPGLPAASEAPASEPLNQLNVGQEMIRQAQEEYRQEQALMAQARRRDALERAEASGVFMEQVQKVVVAACVGAVVGLVIPGRWFGGER